MRTYGPRAAGARITMDDVEITIPDPSLVLLVGPAGAGKSTFAKAHFRASEIVSSDAMREMLTGDAGDQEATAEAFQVLSIIVNGRLRRRLLTIVDATNLRAANRKRYRRLAARYGIPTVVIAFDLRTATYRARNSARDDRVVPEFVITDQAARMAAALDYLTEEGYAGVFVIDEAAALPGIAELSVRRDSNLALRRAAPTTDSGTG